MKSTHALAFSSVLLVVAACGDADDPAVDAPAVDATPVDAAPAIDAALPVDASTVARIAATVSYAGSAQGTLILATFPAMPPMGPPAGFAQRANPTFPAMLAIEDLQAGPAYVFAMLDVAPASPQMPGPEDRTVWSAQLTLAVGQTATVELTLTDPAGP